MSFYACPGANAAIRELFRDQPKGNVRQPISSRAAPAAARAQQFYGQAVALCQEQQFILGSNQFTLYRSEGVPDTKLLALTISHLAAMFSDKYIGLWARILPPEYDRALNIVSWVGKEKTDYPKWRFALPKEAQDAQILNLDFELKDQFMGLNFIRSKARGAGGAALLAVYDIAQQMGMKEIKYFVSPDNKKGQRFYVHMDFGKPIDGETEWWQLNLR